MATVTGLTADRMLQIEAASVVDGDVIAGHLILTKHDGTQIDAGSVTGPQGVPGPMGQDLQVLAAVPVLEVGMGGQIRAGRQLSLADFTSMGLSAPIGLWNLSDLTDASGNGRALLNKGGVTFTAGVNGVANTAANFKGDQTQALYIADAGAGDPFRIRTGSFGCWFRCFFQGNYQMLLSKWDDTGGAGAYKRCYRMYIDQSNALNVDISPDGNATAINYVGSNAMADNKWHFAVATVDGSVFRVYIDGKLWGISRVNALISNASAVPLNIGNSGANASTVGAYAADACVDEAFVTSDVLSEGQVRNLYCAKIPHALPTLPLRASLNVHPRVRGAALAAADFPAPPLRLYNFSGGSLGDEGTNNQILINGNGAVPVPGVDGSAGNAFAVSQPLSQSLYSTDAGLPSGVATRSYGMWFAGPTSSAGYAMFGWGNQAGLTDEYLLINSGGIVTLSGGNGLQGPPLNDGWAFIVVTEENVPADNVKRKLYVNGKLVNSSSVLNPVTPGGANHFRIGGACDGTNYATGQFDGVFVCDYALTREQIYKLYLKSFLTYPPTLKNAGDHIEGIYANNLLATFDTLEPQYTVDLTVG